MSKIEEFLVSLKKKQELDPMTQRWLYGTEELQRTLFERIVRLFLYPDLIPDDLKELYMQAKSEAAEKLI